MASKLEQDISAAVEAANRAATSSPVDDFVGRLADRIGAHANVRAVFGEPIARENLVVVPVAKVRWGFGGGAGRGPLPTAGSPVGAGAGDDATAGEPELEGAMPGGGQGGGSGQGGGGAASAEPIGWLEITDDGAEFRPIEPVMPSPAFILAGSFGVAMMLRALAKLLRR